MNARFTDKAFWQALLPQLTIGTPGGPAEALDFSEPELAQISSGLSQDGYLRLPALFGAADVAPLADAMLILTDAEIPPVYIYLFDQSWRIFAKLDRLVSHFLGDRYGVLPNFWAWHLDRPGQSGWPPHRDCNIPTVLSAGDEMILLSLSLWISLTAVDARNGCMHVIPRRCQDRYDREPALLKDIDPADDVALAAPAGSVLGWPQDLYHWGGAFTPAARNPRSSLSFEFQNRAFDPLAEPLLDVNHPPDFETRLDLINDQFKKYRHIAGD